MEEWKVAIEMYEISNYGNYRKKLHNGNFSIVKGSLLNRGYRYFQLCRNNKRTNYLFHHLVAEHFIGPRPESLVIDHIDRNKLNNQVSNLRYITQKENMFNQDRVLAHIPQDTPNRRSLCVQDYEKRNKEMVLTKKKEHYHKNKEFFSEYRKDNYIKYKERISDYGKEYREKNKDKIIELKAKVCLCECGASIKHGNMSEHKKSIKHKINVGNDKL